MSSFCATFANTRFFFSNFLCQVLFFFFKGAEERWRCFFSCREGPESWGGCLTAALELSQDWERERRHSWSIESCSFACFTSGWDGRRIGDATPVVSGNSISTSRSEARRRLARWQVKIRQSVSFHLKPKKTTGWWTVDGYVIFWTSSFINQAPKADTDLIAWCSAAAFLHRKEGRKNRVTCLFD